MSEFAPPVCVDLAPPMPEVPVAQPNVAWSAETRYAHLLSLPHPGFTEAGHAELVDDIVAVGLPVNNIQTLIHRPSKMSDELILGSWGTGEANYGEFSLYEAVDWLPGQHRRDVLVHELLHANSAFEPHNDAIFGGEESRLEAMNFALGLASQTLTTGRYLSPYQHKLADLHRDDKITFEHFAEESAAIAGQLAIGNRAHLHQVQEAQRAIIEEKWLNGELPFGTGFAELMSHQSLGGEEMVLAGADKTLAKLTDGVENYDDLLRHADALKARFAGRPGREVPVWEEPPVIVVCIGRAVIDLLAADLEAEEERRRRKESQSFSDILPLP